MWIKEKKRKLILNEPFLLILDSLKQLEAMGGKYLVNHK